MPCEIQLNINMKYFKASQMEYEKSQSQTDPKKSHKYSKSTIPTNLQKPQLPATEKKIHVPGPLSKKIYPAVAASSVNKTMNGKYPAGIIHKKSISTVQGGSAYNMSGKASELLAHITAKYGVPYTKGDAKKDLTAKPTSTTLIPNSIELQATLKEILKHDPSVTMEPLMGTTIKSTSIGIIRL